MTRIAFAYQERCANPALDLNWGSHLGHTEGAWYSIEGVEHPLLKTPLLLLFGKRRTGFESQPLLSEASSDPYAQKSKVPVLVDQFLNGTACCVMYSSTREPRPLDPGPI